MAFADCEPHAAIAEFLHLENDKDSVVAIFLDEPLPREGAFRNSTRIQFIFPLMTKEGIKIWTVGKLMYRKLFDLWDDVAGIPVTITRKGKKKSLDTTYEVVPYKGEDAKALIDAASNVTKETLEAVFNAGKAMTLDKDSDIPA